MKRNLIGVTIALALLAGIAGVPTPQEFPDFSRLSAPRLLAQTGLGQWGDQRFRNLWVKADFTTASGSLVTITGLSWSMPGGAAITAGFVCELHQSQATAAVANAYGMQVATTSPTNVEASGMVGTAATTIATGSANITNTTATNIVAFTPSAITTVWPAHLVGFIENANNTGDNIINIMVLTGNASDSVTVKRGSFCRVL